MKKAFNFFKAAVFVGILLMIVFTVSAQQKTVSGVVTDNSGGRLPGVTVVATGTTVGTVTNGNGEFSLSIPENAQSLTFSFVGMRTTEVPVDGNITFSIVLQEESIGLQEVVAVGYGTQKKVNLTGAVASVSSEVFEGIPVTNAGQLLNGRVSGVNITANSGRPGDDDVRIRIRGFGTLNNRDPLVLIDGIEGNIGDLDPNQIESISILKDAAAGAIYGIRAANGVVLVTTKRGKAGEKMFIDYTFNYSQQEVIKDLEMLNAKEYALSKNSAFEYAGQAKPYTQEEIDKLGKGTNWFREVMQAAPMVNHNLTFSGSTDKTTYAVSLGFADQEGVMKGVETKKYNFRTNLESKLNDIFTLSTNIGFVRRFNDSQHWNRGNSGASDDQNEMLKNSYRVAPTVPVYNTDGTFGQPISPFETEAKDLINPLWVLEQGFINQEWENRFDGSVSLEAEVYDGLKIKTSIGGNMYFNADKYYTPMYTAYARIENPDGTTAQGTQIVRSNTANQLWRGEYRGYIPQWTNLITYNNDFGNHTINGLLGYELRWSENYYTRSYVQGFTTDFLTEFDQGSVFVNTEGSTNEWSTISYFSRVNYVYADRYLFEANFRRDGTSKFINNPWGNFPSFSAGWIISEEDFFKNSVSFISLLKIRGSWGQVGNDGVGNYVGYSTVGVNPAYVFNNKAQLGTSFSEVANEELVWETTTTTDFGFDLAMLRGRLTLIADYYNKITDDILRGVSYPDHAGIPSPSANIGKMLNKGFEFALGFNNKSGDFSYGANATFSYNHNELLELDLEEGAIKFENGNRSVLKVGEPAYAIWGWKTDGLFQNQAELDNYPHRNGTIPGDLKFLDLKEDGIINEEDKTIIGNVIPKINYGLSLNAAWKGFDLNIHFQGVEGVDRVLANYGLNIASANNNIYSFWKDSWKGEGTSNTIPIIRRGHTVSVNNVSVMSDFLVQDASFLRIKSAQFGYTVPASIIQKTGFIDNLRIYLSGSNLHTWTKYIGFDPELGDEDDRSQGLEYPTPRIITFGVNVRF